MLNLPSSFFFMLKTPKDIGTSVIVTVEPSVFPSFPSQAITAIVLLGIALNISPTLTGAVNPNSAKEVKVFVPSAELPSPPSSCIGGTSNLL